MKIETIQDIYIDDDMHILRGNESYISYQLYRLKLYINRLINRGK